MPSMWYIAKSFGAFYREALPSFDEAVSVAEQYARAGGLPSTISRDGLELAVVYADRVVMR